jgi:hypothetical protein
MKWKKVNKIYIFSLLFFFHNTDKLQTQQIITMWKNYDKKAATFSGSSCGNYSNRVQ